MMNIIYPVKGHWEAIMRASREEKERSRARIINGASRLFRLRGIDGASIGDVMKEAGLTHGGFYRHFESKDDLLVAALNEAFAEMIERMTKGLQDQPAAVARTLFRDFYLSRDHVDAPESGCPAAALGGDVGRASAVAKEAFGEGFNAMIVALSHTMNGAEADRVEQAIRELLMMVGAVIVARASDPATARALLSVCRAGAVERTLQAS